MLAVDGKQQRVCLHAVPADGGTQPRDRLSVLRQPAIIVALQGRAVSIDGCCMKQCSWQACQLQLAAASTTVK